MVNKVKQYLLRNYLKLRNSHLLRRHVPIRNVKIEITTRCNLRCCDCFRTLHDFEAKNKDMSFADFKKIVDMLPKVDSIGLHGMGEPTLNKDICRMVEYASKSKNIGRVSFTTNALAKAPQIYDDLFASGLHDIIISVDSLDHDDVMKVRPPTKVDRLKENIKYLAQKHNGKISISIMISKKTLKSFEKTLKELSKLGVSSVSCHPYEDRGHSSYLLSDEDKEYVLRKIQQVQKKTPAKINASSWFNQEFLPCDYIVRNPVVTVDGSITPCCFVPDKNVFNFGSVKDKSFKTIFFSKEVSNMQKNIYKGKYPFFCESCMRNHL